MVKVRENLAFSVNIETLTELISKKENMSISKNFIDKREKSLGKNEFMVFLLRNTKIVGIL